MKKIFYSQLLLWVLAAPVAAQSNLSPLQDKIAGNLQSYFALDRETIHLHLNKNVYLSNERVWIKGYITEKKGKPTFLTSNVYISLYDEKSQKIASQLYFAENGIFEGHLNLPGNLASGVYYLQAFTNFMNNFSEDESSVYKITILNTADKSVGWQRKINFDQLEVHFYPESGVFLEGVSNTVGFRIADCAATGLPGQVIEVTNAHGDVVAHTITDRYGYGRFELYDTAREIYKLHFTANGIAQVRPLPMPSATGVTFSINNFVFPDKALVKVKTNAATAKIHPDAKYTLAVVQNEAVSFAAVQLNSGSPEQDIIVPRSEISAGINAVYLVDEKLQLLCQRLIFDPFETTQKSLLQVSSKTQQSFTITGSTPVRAASLSISVLPAASVNLHPDKPIQAGLAFDNYLSAPLPHLDYYLTDFSRQKHLELDNALLSLQPKYDWMRLMGSPPVKKYESDFGLSVRGTINSENRGEIYKVNMRSTALGFDEFKSVDSNNQFEFDHLLAIDSSKIYFLPKDKTGKLLEHRIGCQILDNNRRLIKPFLAHAVHCATPDAFEAALPFPKIENSILLDSITLVAKKNKLNYRNRIGNITARGFKITNADAHKMLLSFLSANGYNVSRNQGSVWITSNLAGAGNMQSLIAINNRAGQNVQRARGPAVFIDDMLVPNYDMLDNFSMSRIDEIYLNKNANDPAIIQSDGVIKIYTNRNLGMTLSPTGTAFMVVKNGFQKYTPFTNPKYDNVRDEGFQKLGTISWQPIVETDEHGTFSFTIPNLYQKSVLVTLEGIAPDGTMISESQLLELP